MRRIAPLAAVVVLASACGVPADASARAYPLSTQASRLLASDRPFAARLAGSAAWVPCRVVDSSVPRLGIACANVRRHATVADVAALAGRIRAARSPSDADVAYADVAYAGAIVDLAFAAERPELLDRVIDQLTDVITQDARHAAPLNDRAVAYLARAGAHGDAVDVFAALDDVERAARLDTTSAVIAFNRALVLQRVGLYGEAAATWHAFLATDPPVDWAREARGHLDALQDRPRASRDVARSDPQGARELVLDSLLPSWGSATLARDSTRTARTLDAAMGIGEALAAGTGDSSVVHLARECVRTGEAARTLAAAVADLARGADAFRAAAYGRASPALETAARRARAADAPSLTGWADVLLAAVELYRGDYAAAEARYARVERTARARGELALTARALWGQALSLARRGRSGEAAERYAAADAIFWRIGELSNHGAMQSQLGDVLFLVGRDEAALHAKARALAALHVRRDARVRHGPLLALGRQLSERGLTGASIAVLREAVRSADDTGRPMDRPDALVRLSSAEAVAGQADQAHAHLAAARAALPGVDDALMRSRLAMEAASAEAAVLADRAPAAAIARLREVDDYYRRQGIVIGRAPALTRSARLRLRLADTAAAERDLDTAIVALEAQTTVAGDPTAARDLAAARREVYRELVGIRVARHDTLAAYRLAARARGWGALSQAPAAETPRIEYTTLRHELLVWIAAGARRRLVRVPVGAEQLRARIDRFEALIRRDADSVAVATEARALFDLLLAPAWPDARRAGALVLVADGALGRLPFAGLVDAAGRHVVESVALRFASVPAASPEPRPHHAERARAAVIVGDPAFEGALFRELEPLREAAREASALAAAFARPTVLTADAATKTAVTRALRRATIFHFAGHARLVERVPALSHLVLARQPGGFDANALTAAEIARLDLRRLQLVVLASCGTTQARSRRDDHEDGLADAFLQAGAGGVVGSLWEADDAGTAVLMRALHEELASGADAAEALRRAQVRMLGGGAGMRSPRLWSAFRYEAR
ncbi:CHAT domain-containing protein [Roseisolibacter agri]|uniref:CHAT domain-containing protein n=1 Tax=Roseisolibacter agri TaxID=2014610 RepID=A0AA37QJT7_9BACT|nr:CHAT domain-containing protein [Roseisolibacter agri]GLC27810.1 hypothetical protein rosag_43230 [Roseisolibacter agri]